MKNNKQMKFDITILVCHILNVLMVLLISLGIFSDAKFVPFFLMCSMTLFIIILMGLKWWNVKTTSEGKRVFEYLPFMSIGALEIIYGVKITLQLIDEAVCMSVVCLFTFLLVCGMGVFLYKEKCEDVKKKLIGYALLYFSFILYLLVCEVLLLDWWFI